MNSAGATKHTKASLKSRAQAVLNRTHHLGDDAELVEAARHLAALAAELVQTVHRDEDESVRRAARLLAAADHLLSAED